MSSCRKIRYRTKLDAKIALASTQHSTDPKREEVRIYWCTEHRGYHLTSQAKK